MPPDLLARVAAGQVDGIDPQRDYHLGPNERLNEAISRSWNRLQTVWAGYKDSLAKLPLGGTTTTETRERWLLLLFQELGFGRLQQARALDVGGRTYAVSHLWESVPIHLVGAHLSLDRRVPGQVGAARTSPHGLIQQLLNASDDYLWGIVSNGLLLRILRDNATMTRQAYVEFDLEEMMDGQVYSDFVLLWLVTHQSRFEGRPPADCWLERWLKEAQQAGVRALDQLRDGVEQAISVLGRAFIAHQANTALRDRLRSGELDAQEYYRQLLRVVYRLIFLFVAEARELLLLPDAPTAAKDMYRRFYSVGRLRDLADQQRGASQHGDLWRVMHLVADSLGSDMGCPQLALPPLGSFLWASDSTSAFEGSELANRDVLRAVAALAFVTDGKVRRQVDYGHLGPEELGSVYESLLERHPRINIDSGFFELATVSGNERKTTGSYYTPSSLIACLLDSALNPVLDEAASGADPAAAILELRVVDPACGSGHFLIAAAHRIARRLASVRSGDEEPSPETVRRALRDVIAHCIYAVDMNPMAVELCKVSLWIEALDPGRPLSFLDQHIQVGHSLIGSTPELLASGIPDEAFRPIEGDDIVHCASLRRRNKAEREGQTSFDYREDGLREHSAALAEELATLDSLDDNSIPALHEKERRYRALLTSSDAKRAKLSADAWCASFVASKSRGEPAVTEGVRQGLAIDPASVNAAVLGRVEALAAHFCFFHWHLAFGEVFKEKAGFDVVLGNPPWEQLQLQEQEFFASRDPGIAAAVGATRKRMISQLQTTNPALDAAYRKALRQVEALTHFLRHSGRYPLCGQGRINSYSVFAEAMHSLTSPVGRAGVIVPTGIATDDTTKEFFASIVDKRGLVSIYDFVNQDKLFAEVDSRVKFCLLTLTGEKRPAEHASFVFFARRVEDLAQEDRRFQLTAEDFRLLNPNTRTCPIFRSRRDAEITRRIYERVPVFVDHTRPGGNAWSSRFMQGLFNMTGDSSLFRKRSDLEANGWKLDGNIFGRGDRHFLPLYEGKMFHEYDHRFASYEANSEVRELTADEKLDARRLALPRYWVDEVAVATKLAEYRPEWLLAWRKTARSNDMRTVIVALLPRTAAGDKVPLVLTGTPNAASPVHQLANLASFVLDFVARCKLGGTDLGHFVVEQLPVLPPAAFSAAARWDSRITFGDWVEPRVAELSCTAVDMQPLARSLGLDHGPFRWNAARRELLRAELDAALFHAYGVDRDDVAYVMDTFAIVKRVEESEHHEYRTSRLILERYDALREAIVSGTPYQTVLEPPPADASLSAAYAI